MENKVTIKLPSTIYENSLLKFVAKISQIKKCEQVIIDFNNVRFCIPAVWVAILVIREQLWEDRGVKMEIINYRGNDDLFRYLQRIDFFKHLGIESEEDFIRHDPEGRFVPVKKIMRFKDRSKDYDNIASEIATCLAPQEAKYAEDIEDFNDYDETKTGLYDFIQFSVSELSRNVLKHSKSKGFVSVQYTPTTNYVRLAIADYGIGIRESFRYSPYWDKSMTDLDAIKLAIKPEVSSKNDGSNSMSEHAGMGLTFMKLLCDKLNGRFHVLSKQGYYKLRGERKLPFRFPGTLCCLRFKRIKASLYPKVIGEIKEEIGLPKLSLKDNFI